jgi:glycerol 3-phosphatase-2
VPNITFDQAWQEYRRCEPRLPAKPPAVRPRRIRGVLDIAEAFDLVLLDAWGVLNLGDTAIASALPAVAALRASGKRLVVLSNSGNRNKQAAVARHRRRGFDFSAEEIVAGVDLLPDTLAALALPGPIGLIEDSGLRFDGPALALGDAAADYDAVSGFAFLSSHDWTEERQALLTASLARRPRPLIIGNPDIVSPEPKGMIAEPGHFAHRVADATGLRPIFCGKPFPAIYERVRALHPGVPPERILCVGDTLHTDILGGRAAGFRTLLVEDGFCGGRDGLALAAECAIWPDFIAPGL